MNAVIPHEGPLCGAQTRRGTPCRRRRAPGRPRCNLHGGKSLRGIAHPRFKHGLYSIDDPLLNRAKQKVEQRRRAIWRDYERELDRMGLDEEVSFTSARLALRRAVAKHTRR